MPECIICFHEIQSLDNVVTCSLCKNKFVHIGCYKEWWVSNPKDEDNCIHCRQPNVLIIRKPDRGRDCFLFHFFSKVCCYLR